MTVLLILLLAPQDDLERRIDRIVERFREDDIESRDAAARELEALGPPAVPALLRCAGRADAETRARLLGAARAIERNERLAGCLGRPARITLKADRRPLREAIAELARHSPFPIDGMIVDLERPVSVELKDAPWFEAVERVCRAHGASLPQIDGPGHFIEALPPTVRLARGDPAAARWKVQGAFVVELRGVSHESDQEIGKPRKEESFLNFNVVWEAGARPLKTVLELTSVLDGDGRPLEVEPDEERNPRIVRQRFNLPFKQPLPASVRTFREVSGRAKLEFPGDVHVARVERPLGLKGVEAAGPAGFTLRSCERTGTAIQTVFSTLNVDVYQPPEFRLIDAAGRTYPVQLESGKGNGDGQVTWTSRTELPEGVDPVEFRAVKYETDPARRIERTIEFKFEDVRFR